MTPSSSAMLDDGDGFDTRGTMRMGHVRKRTVSSGVVVLDGMEERARIWESEEEWGGVLGAGERW